MKILLARQYDKKDSFLQRLRVEFTNEGIETEVIQRFTKDDVIEFLKRDNTFDVLVLEEYLQQYLPTDINFFDELLTIAPKLDIVFIASNEHKSEKTLIKSLYKAGINKILFEEDSDVESIMNLIITHQDANIARSYLGLDYDEETIFLTQTEKLPFDNIEDDNNLHENVVSQDLSDNIEDRIVTKEKVIKKEIVKHIYSIPQDYKKVIAIMGLENSGTTTIAANLAYALSMNKLKTTLIDTDYKRKDLYYHFSNDYYGCLSQIMNTQDSFSLGQANNKYLTVFSEHNDVEFELSKDSLLRLLAQAKRNSDIVILDISNALKDDVIKSLLEFSDNILLVANQNINKLYRMSKEVLHFNENIVSPQLVINKYVEGIPHLDKESIKKNFFQELRGEKNDIEKGINQVFIVSDDLKSILEGLAERQPAIRMKDCVFKEDINQIVDFYYKKRTIKKGLINHVIEFLKNN